MTPRGEQAPQTPPAKCRMGCGRDAGANGYCSECDREIWQAAADIDARQASN